MVNVGLRVVLNNRIAELLVSESTRAIGLRVVLNNRIAELALCFIVVPLRFESRVK